MEDDLNFFVKEDNLIFFKMEDDLNFFENGRRPQNFRKWKTTSIFLKMEDNITFQWETEDAFV